MNLAARGRAGADRWLISYAELMTLLFAFSIATFAAQDDRPAVRETASAVMPATAGPSAPLTRPGVTADAAGDELYARLTRELSDALGRQRVELIRDPRGLVVSMPDDAAFPMGSAVTTSDARTLIARVGDTLRSVPNAIRIEGHTDNVPIRTAKYDSNWELSTARASAVVALLITEVGIEASRLSAAGYGEFHPLNPNDTPERRARNRRVDVVVLESPPAARTGAAHVVP